MLKSASFVGYGLLLMITAVWGWFFLKVRPSDKAHLLCLLERQIQSTAEFSSVQQNRVNVVKDIWLAQDDNSRLHNRIKSQSSVLMLKPKGRKSHLIEELHQVSCLMQERVYYKDGLPMQQVRLLEANSGEYNFSEKELLSQGVKISVYRSDTHVLPQEIVTKTPIFSGSAENVSFITSDKTPNFKATGFVAHMYPGSY